MVLDSITLKSFRAPVIHVHGQRYRDGALRIHEPIAVVLVDVQVISDDLKLGTGHSKNIVIVNTHVCMPGLPEEQPISAFQIQPSNAIRWRGARFSLMFERQ